MHSDDKYHLEGLVNGKKDSFVYFHKKYQAKVFHYALKLVRSKEVAQEITSDVFVKIWEKRAMLHTEVTIEGLLFKITRDYAFSYLRKVSRDAKLREDYVRQYFESVQNPIEELLYLKEGLAIADKAIEALPPKCRLVFRLRYFDELSLRQISEELNISTNTVQNHLAKGTRLVKDYLQANSSIVFTCIAIGVFAEAV